MKNFALFVLLYGGCVALKVVAQEVPPGPLPASTPERRAHADALLSALEAYDRMKNAHEDDSPNAKWLSWSGEGYRLVDATETRISLIASLAAKGGGADFALSVQANNCNCNVCSHLHVDVMADGWKSTFLATCSAGHIVYRPESRSNSIRWMRRVRAGGLMSLQVEGMRAVFDLSSVSVVESRLALEALEAAEK